MNVIILGPRGVEEIVGGIDFDVFENAARP